MRLATVFSSASDQHPREDGEFFFFAGGFPRLQAVKVYKGGQHRNGRVPMLLMAASKFFLGQRQSVRKILLRRKQHSLRCTLGRKEVFGFGVYVFSRPDSCKW